MVLGEGQCYHAELIKKLHTFTLIKTFKDKVNFVLMICSAALASQSNAKKNTNNKNRRGKGWYSKFQIYNDF